MYPRIDILRISAILTDTDRTRIEISLFERIRIRILCHGHSTDIILFYFSNFISCLMSIVYIRQRHTLKSYRESLQWDTTATKDRVEAIIKVHVDSTNFFLILSISTFQLPQLINKLNKPYSHPTNQHNDSTMFLHGVGL